MGWNISYLQVVEAWLDGLTKEQFKSIVKELRLLECCGNKLRLPHSKSLGGWLFELRERRFSLRLYYCFHDKRVIMILHGGGKSSQSDDIEKARGLLKMLLREV